MLESAYDPSREVSAVTRLVLFLALLSSPIAAWAQCSGHSEQQATSCAEGSTWDQDTNACVPIVTG
jgi:hypothetical protein